MKLNIGCGEKEIEGAVNLDYRETGITDVVHDITNIPWPFKDEEFEAVYAIDIMEHIIRVIPIVDECWRILNVGGRLYIRTNYFNTENAYSDPTHYHYFTLDSFDYFDPNTPLGNAYSYYTDKKWTVLDASLDKYMNSCFELMKI